MVGNLASVPMAPARTAAPSASKAEIVRSGTFSPAGNNVAASGGDLPHIEHVPVVDVRRAVERLNELMSGMERSLRFAVDEGSGRTVITVINPTTKEIVRQIPSEELLEIARRLEQLGSLIDTSA
jgi:flagellar protein FlaG